MQRMKAADVVAHYGAGRPTRAAEALGLSRQTIHKWLRNGVPLGWQAWIERDTAGHLRAERRRPNAFEQRKDPSPKM